ncbi:MAG: GAF domain-containing protein [Fimbriimonadaceae bacterium]
MIVELCVRLGLAIAVAAGGLLTGQKQGEFSVQIALVYSLVSISVFAIDWYKKRNPGVAGFVAVFDAMFIASVLSSLGQLDRYGFMVLAPMMWATGRYSSDAAAMAPLVAATVMVCSNFFGGPGFTLPTMLHTLGILLIGLLTNQAKVIVKDREVEVEVTREIQFESEESIRMKETYSSLKSHIAELEESTKRERLGMKLWAAANGNDEPPMIAMAGKLREDTALEGVAIYTLNKADRRFVVSAVSGKVPEKIRHSALMIGKGLSEAQMVDRLNRQLSEMRDQDRAIKIRSLILKERGKPCGCVAMFDLHAPALDSAMTNTKPVVDYLGGLVSQAVKKDDELRRLREAEVLYGVASVSLGADSKQNLITRVLREIGEVIQVDHLAGFIIDGTDARLVTTVGATHRVMDHLSFAYGSGISGWLATQSPEVIAPDALEDDRIDRAIALKNRIGSLAVIPIMDGDTALGFITASTHRVGGIDRARLETLRAVTAELTQALIRQEPGVDAPLGAMTPTEFYAAVRSGGSGHFVYFDIVNREPLLKEFGKPAVDAAMRKFTHRLRMRLPSGGGMCRRDEGDFVAYLSGQSDDAANRWGNDSAGVLNGLNLTTPDGRHRLGFIVRAKVAPFAPQKPQVSEQEVV